MVVGLMHTHTYTHTHTHIHTSTVTKFFNRLLALSVEAQHLIFEFYERIYGNELLNAKERGGHDACVPPRLSVCLFVYCMYTCMRGCRTPTDVVKLMEARHHHTHTNSGVMTLYANKILGSEPDTLMYINGKRSIHQADPTHPSS